MDVQLDSVEVTVKSSQITYDSAGGFWWAFDADVGPGLQVQVQISQSTRGISVDTVFDTNVAERVFSDIDEVDTSSLVLNMVAGLLPDRDVINEDVNTVPSILN